MSRLLTYIWGSPCLELVAAATLAGCTARPLPPDALRAWVADPAHGLTLTDSAGAVVGTCTYRPPDLLAAQDLRNSGQPLTAAAVDSARTLYGNSSRFALRLRQNGGSYEAAFATDPARFAAAVSYLSEGLAADAWLSTSEPSPADSVRARAVLYAPQYGQGDGSSTVLLIFPTPPAALVAKGARLIIGGSSEQLPRLHFQFTGEAFDKMPSVAVEP